MTSTPNVFELNAEATCEISPAAELRRAEEQVGKPDDLWLRSNPDDLWLSPDPPRLLPAGACHVAALTCLTSENGDGGLAVEAGLRLTF